jgi:hypothetical protein
MRKELLILAFTLFIAPAFSQVITTCPPVLFDFEGPYWWNNPGSSNQWERGVPAASFINSSYGGVKAWATNLDSNYKNNSADTLWSPKFYVSNTPEGFIGFWHMMRVSDSTDGGYICMVNEQGTFTHLGSIGDPNCTNWYNSVSSGKQIWSNSDTAWQYSEYHYKNVNFPTSDTIIQLCFIFISDSIGTDDGWAIDDFRFAIPPIAIDAGVISLDTINTPITGAPLGVQITVKNFGTDTLYDIPVAYAIPGYPVVRDTMSGMLLPNDTAAFVFNTQFIVPSIPFTLCSWTEVPNDQFPFFDTTCIDLPVLPSYDIGVSAIDNPPGSIQSGTIQTVKVKVTNYGTLPVYQFDISYRLNSNAPIIQLFVDTLLPGSTKNYVHIMPFYVSNVNKICAWTTLTNDVDLTNDMVCKTLFVVPQAQPLPIAEGSITNGISNETDNNPYLFIYPNPTDGDITINVSEVSQSINVTIRNIMGKVIQSKVYNSTNQLCIEIKDSPGIYIIEVSTDNGVKTLFKVVKR